MRKLFIPLLAIVMSLSAVSSLQAQAPQRTKADRAQSSPQRGSSYQDSRPKSAVENQQRKFTDPLNANGR